MNIFITYTFNLCGVNSIFFVSVSFFYLFYRNASHIGDLFRDKGSEAKDLNGNSLLNYLGKCKSFIISRHYHKFCFCVIHVMSGTMNLCLLGM